MPEAFVSERAAILCECSVENALPAELPLLEAKDFWIGGGKTNDSLRVDRWVLFKIGSERLLILAPISDHNLR